VAVVLVALIARDVVLRVTNGRQRGADVMQVAKALDSETVRLSETRASLEALHRTNSVEHEELGRLIDAVRADVAVLKTTSSLRGPR
jgi:hypothetical protein